VFSSACTKPETGITELKPPPSFHSLCSTMSSTSKSAQPSLLPVVVAADNFPGHVYADYFPSYHPSLGERYVPFHLTFADYQAQLPAIGQLRPDVLAELQSDERDPETCPWQFHSLAEDNKDDDLELQVRCVFFADWVIAGGKEMMGKVMQDTAEKWKAEGKFPKPLGGECGPLSSA